MTDKIGDLRKSSRPNIIEKPKKRIQDEKPKQTNHYGYVGFDLTKPPLSQSLRPYNTIIQKKDEEEKIVEEEKEEKKEEEKKEEKKDVKKPQQVQNTYVMINIAEGTSKNEDDAGVIEGEPPEEESSTVCPVFPDEVEEDIDELRGIYQLPNLSVQPVRILGKGFFGEVFEGKWNDKKVALKSIDIADVAKKSELSKKEIIESIKWELSCLSIVKHKNCVQFYGVYQHTPKTRSYLVMEYCDNGTLEYQLQNFRYSWEKKWQWSFEISQGLKYLHHRGIVHRDLKAENILIDINSCAKISDFGVSQVDSLLADKQCAVVQKGMTDLRFLAPEILLQEASSSIITDIYSLGLLFWQISTDGAVPDYITTEEQKKNLINEPDKYSREIIPELTPNWYKELIKLCWKPPKDRPEIEDVIDALNVTGKKLYPDINMVHVLAPINDIIHPKKN
jgi:tRNA A-37 threonylcarbamoyl transferase component Bud32